MIRFLLPILFCASIFGQDQTERILRYQTAATPQSRQEIGLVLKSIAEGLRVNVDVAAGTLTIAGSEELMNAGEWMFQQLDQPAAVQAAAAKPLIYGAPLFGDQIRIIHVAYASQPQELQESATVVRSIAEIRRLFIYNEGRAIVFRGPERDLAIAEWVAAQLEQAVPLSPDQRKSSEYRVAGSASDDVVGIQFLRNPPSLSSFQEVVTVARTIAAIPKMFTYSSLQASLYRGTSAQIALADWLLHELDQPSTFEKRAPSPVFITTGKGLDEEAVRVFYVNQAPSVADFQQVALKVRRSAGVKRLATYNSSKALVVIGTKTQISQAESELQ